jgi:methylisocitrate lyase
VAPLKKGSKPESPASILKRMISGENTTLAPGVFSPIVAMLAEESGFEVLYFSGGGFSNLQGMPDLGVTTLTEVAEATSRITAVTKLPLIVDTDTGFGEAVNVVRTVQEMRRAGAAAIQIEDQVMPKRCGHLDGKEVVRVDEMVKKLVSAKESGQDDLLLIARTDARAVEGMDSAIERARLYVRAGADIIFPEALESRGEFEEFRKKVRVPLLANMTEFGKTPYMSVSDFHQLGYNIVIFPMTLFRTMLKTVKEALTELKKSGTQKALLSRMMTREEVYGLIDYYRYEDVDSRALKAAQKLQKARSA